MSSFSVFIILSPHLPKPSKKDFVQYIPLNMVVPGGGGGGGGGGRPAAGKPARAARKRRSAT